MENNYKTPHKPRKSIMNSNFTPIEAQVNFGSNLMKAIDSYQTDTKTMNIKPRHSVKNSSILSNNSRYYQQYANQLERENKHNSNKVHKHKRKLSSLMEIHDNNRHQQLNHILDTADIPKAYKSGIHLKKKKNLSSVMINKKHEHMTYGGEFIKQSPTDMSSSPDYKKKRSNAHLQTNSNLKNPLFFMKNERKLLMMENKSFANAKNITTLIMNNSNNNDKTKQDDYSQLKTEGNQLRNSAHNVLIKDNIIISHFSPKTKERKRNKKFNSTPKFDHTTINNFPIVNDNTLKNHKEIFIKKYEEKKTKCANVLLLLNKNAKKQHLKENINNTHINNNNISLNNDNKIVADCNNLNNEKIVIKMPITVSEIPMPKKRRSLLFCCFPINE